MRATVKRLLRYKTKCVYDVILRGNWKLNIASRNDEMQQITLLTFSLCPKCFFALPFKLRCPPL